MRRMQQVQQVDLELLRRTSQTETGRIEKHEIGLELQRFVRQPFDAGLHRQQMA